ncbi:RagB/SusD family nutrient uptake outer membrane protein [Hymenobacter endophyticus]|uniref:RagB/SusD family nutrient uptake outer membrane protein n=1 Tax=Hymenobacter endophyticus TaxID=3076335 RepID=A0ABU3TFZ6_9BACT|nr:RagB/SusD family nutrient uptake outer membrane protein [Hymenobacter endophyticus]MDU0370307.1 RagB/SusD family nutrient uptake outer membrane protein [Hymenobacter endophyticus]
MKLHTLRFAALASSLLLTTACDKDFLDQVNPNQPTTESFWKTESDAVKGINACYSGLQQLGTYRRWLHFAYDLRSDDSFSQSPWGELADFTRFTQANYDFEVSQNLWRDHYRAIWRTNQVLANVPAIQMNETLKKRVLAEAKFLRALYYFNLVTLYGNVPLALTPSDPNALPAQATSEGQVWEQIVKDLLDAKPDLDVSYGGGNDTGRATRGAATTLLGKAYMQQRLWTQASAQFAEVISSNRYRLTANFTDNFRHTTENNSESIFEVQFSDAKLGGNDGDDATSSEGGQRSQFWGVPGAGFVDGEVRPWVVNEFLREPTATGARDPRLASTVFYNRRQFTSSLPVDGDTLVYGNGFLRRFRGNARDLSRVYWRKYQTDYFRTFENFDSPINHRVMRYADVLLLQAEALNEQGVTSDAIPLINQVRSRSGLAPLTAGSFTRETLRAQLMHERVTELTGEGLRFFDLKRWGLLDNQAGIDQLKARDTDFNTFRLDRSRLLPIPQTEIDLARYQQNPGW